jgi:hypothetical protein
MHSKVQLLSPTSPFRQGSHPSGNLHSLMPDPSLLSLSQQGSYPSGVMHS